MMSLLLSKNGESDVEMELDTKALNIPKKNAEQEAVSGATSILSHPGKNPFLLFTTFNILLVIPFLMYV